MFGTARLLEIIGREGPSGGSAIETSVLKAIDDFTNGEPQTDDITFMTIEKFGD
jgi:serine phosphatase RsbU (regulator of sigma subunit)